MTTGLAAAVAAAEAVPERRLVTVLFADLAGYTALCARLDPEDVHDVVRPAMRSLRAVAESYGATVPGIQGDGFMAVFGAPVAHEDDAERAVRAAFALHDALRRINATGRALQVPDLHIGIDSGEVAVWCGGDLDVSIAGDAVNRGARMCGIAVPGEVCVGPRTVELTQGRVTYEGPTAMAIRGIGEPVDVYRAVGIRDDALPGRRTMSVRTPFVGRDSVLKHLDVTLERVRAGGSSEVVALVGDAGNGKSRLAHEWTGSCADVAVVTVGCSSYDDDPLAPWSSLVPGLASRAATSPDDDPGAAAAHAVRDRLVALAAERPAVVVLDDLHWASDEALSVLERLQAAPAAAPVVLVALARPDGWRGSVPSCPLSPLDDGEMSALLEATIGTALPRPAAEALKRRSGGNPLFLEECLHLLLDSGAIGPPPPAVSATEAIDEIPSSMRQFITARLDALPPAERLLLQEAAVAGDVVWDEWLRSSDPTRDIGALLESLEVRGLLRALTSSTVPGSREHAFKHALIREVAYESVSRRVRAARHESLATWLAAKGDLPDSLLAHHYATAWELAAADAAASGPPGCTLAAAAVRHLRRHAEEVEGGQPRRAAAALSRALAITEAAPQCFDAAVPTELRVARAAARVELQDLAGALADLDRAEPAVAVAGNEAQHGRAVLVRAQVLSTQSRVDEAAPLFAEAIGLLRRAGDERRLAHAHRHSAYTSRLRDRSAFIAGLHHAHDALVDAGDQAGARDVAIELAYEHSMAGGPAYRRWHRAAEAAGDLDRDPRARAALRRCEAFLAQHRGQSNAALQLARAAYDDAAAVGATRLLVDAVVCRLAATAALGLVEENERAYDEARAIAATTGRRRVEAMADIFSARARLLARDVVAAEERLRAGRATMTALGDVHNRDAECVEVAVALDRGDWARAAALAERTASAYDSAGAGLSAVPLHRAVGRAALGAEPARALDSLAEALDAARRHDAPQYGALAAALLEQAQLLTGRPTSQRIGAAPEPSTELTAVERENDGIRAGLRADWEEAARAFGDAARAWAEPGATVWSARALVWQAEALRRAGAEVPAESAAVVAATLADLGADLGLADLFGAQLPSADGRQSRE